MQGLRTVLFLCYVGLLLQLPTNLFAVENLVDAEVLSNMTDSGFVRQHTWTWLRCVSLGGGVLAVGTTFYHAIERRRSTSRQ